MWLRKTFFFIKFLLLIQILVYFIKKLQTPPEKSYHLFPSNRPLKIEILSSPPFRNFGRRLNPFPPSRRGRGFHTTATSTHLTVPLILQDWFFSQEYFLIFLKVSSNIAFQGFPSFLGFWEPCISIRELTGLLNQISIKHCQPGVKLLQVLDNFLHFK